MLCRNAVAMHESLYQNATVNLVPLGHELMRQDKRKS